MRRRATTTLALALALGPWALAGVADAATGSFTATLNPQGSAAVGQPVDVKLKFTANTDATGPVPARKIAMALPDGFSDRLAEYATCDRQQVVSKGPDGCPPESIAGSGVLSVVVPSLQIKSTSDRAVIVNLGGGKLIMWFKATNPVDYIGTVDATVTKQGAPYGPTVTWDFTPYTDGTPETRTVSLQVTFPRGDASAPPPASNTAKSKSKSKTKTKRQACERRARKTRNRKRRTAALRKCRHRYPRKSRSARAAVTRSPFSAGQCPADGTWHFAAQVEYRDGPATHEATLGCGSSSPPPAPPGGQPPPAPPLCVPPIPGCAGVRAQPRDGF